jgi:hypothetical protein
MESADGHAPIEIEDERSTPFDQAASHEVQQAVRRALQNVPEVFRSAVILRDLEGMSYEEVAEVLCVSAGTVKSRILRGRRLLRELLEPLLRNPHCSHGAAQTPRQDHRPQRQNSRMESVLQSTLFPRVEDTAAPEAGNAMEQKSSGRCDTTGWAFSGTPGDAEEGV